MSRKPLYLSKTQCTLFDFYTAKELEELVRSAPQLGFTAQQAAGGSVRFYARDTQGRKRQLPKAIAEQSYLAHRMHQADQLLEQGRLNSHGVTVILDQRTERALYYQDRRDGKGPQPIDGRRAQEAMAAYRQFRARMKERNIQEAVHLAREYLPNDCLRVAEKAHARLNGRGEKTEREKIIREYELLIQQGTLESVEKAARLARERALREEAERAERELFRLYNAVSLDEFAAWESGIRNFSAQSPVEEELRSEYGGNPWESSKSIGEQEEHSDEEAVRRNTGNVFGKGLAGVEM